MIQLSILLLTIENQTSKLPEPVPTAVIAASLQTMPIYEFKPNNPESLVSHIFVENNVMTIFYNEKNSEIFSKRYHFDISKMVRITNGDNTPYQYIHSNEKEHRHLHDNIDENINNEFHHHVSLTRAIGLFDIWYYFKGMVVFFEKLPKLTHEGMTYLSRQDFNGLLSSYVKFSELKSYNQSIHGLELQYSHLVNRDSYINSLRKIVGKNNITYDDKLNHYCLTNAWLKQLGHNAKRELSDNLNVKLSDLTAFRIKP